MLKEKEKPLASKTHKYVKNLSAKQLDDSVNPKQQNSDNLVIISGMNAKIPAEKLSNALIGHFTQAVNVVVSKSFTRRK